MAPAFSDITQYLRGQLFQTPALPSVSLKGQTVVITGANSGLGFECAKQLWRLGVSTLILGCRSIERGEAAKSAIMRDSTNKGEVQVWQLDMDKYDSVKAFATRLTGELPRIDALLLNAGISTNQFVPAENSESTLVTNVISTFLLAYLSLPILKRSAKSKGSPSRMVITGSIVHAFVNPHEVVDAPPDKVFATLSDPTMADMGARYFLSKLLVMMGVQQMAKSLNPNEVILNCPNPGWCKTPLFRTDDGGAIGRFMLGIMGRQADIGARCITSAAVAGPETHGQYLSECQVKRASVWLRSEQGREMETKVWKDLLHVLHSISPEIAD